MKTNDFVDYDTDFGTEGCSVRRVKIVDVEEDMLLVTDIFGYHFRISKSQARPANDVNREFFDWHIDNWRSRTGSAMAR